MTWRLARVQSNPVGGSTGRSGYVFLVLALRDWRAAQSGQVAVLPDRLAPARAVAGAALETHRLNLLSGAISGQVLGMGTFLVPPTLPALRRASSRAVPERPNDEHDGFREIRSA